MVNKLVKFPLFINTRLGFSVVVIVILTLSMLIAGISYLSHINMRMRDIVEKGNVKTDLAGTMRNALRERALNLYNIAVIKDAFVRDDELLRFHEYGTQYYQARQRMDELAVTPEERLILDKISDLIRTTQNKVQKDVELLLKGGDFSDVGFIRERILPIQMKTNEQVDKLITLEKMLVSTRLKDAELSYEYTSRWILALGSVASLLIILFSALVSRKVSKQANELEHQAFHDGLTKLPNRDLFMDRLGQAIVRCARENGNFAILLLDLDRFKEINDTLGHNAGDQLLVEVSGRLTGTVRESDTVARFGGDEFVILLEQSNLQHAQDLAEKLLKVLEQPIKLAGQLVDVSGSFGIACFPVHGEDALTLIQKADVAMYAAKRSQAGIAIYSGSQEQGSKTDLAFSSELLHALQHDELVLFFQPKIDLRSNRVTSVESLVRWQHPQRGFLAPDLFIPQAEQSGLIDQLTIWVLKNALAQCAAFNASGISISVAVNFSARSLHDIRLPGEVARLLSEAKVEPAMLVIEITESAVMSDREDALEVLQILDGMGVTLSIDDFGTGYSSLLYLTRLPVDEIKIDKSFVMGMIRDEQAAAIVHSTINLGHSLGKKVVAEGVETPEMLELLKKWGCDTAQGYFMSKPIPADALKIWLHESEWNIAG